MTALEIPADQYHADQVGHDQPSLSASLAHILCTSSPAHARAAHPRLNPNFEREEKAHFDIGTVAHSILLQGDDSVRVVHMDDWRTKEARELRDEARAAGQVPLLEKHHDAVQAMVAAAREQLPALDVIPPLFTDGKPEQTIVWDDDGVTCRARIDWLRDDLAAIDDYKTTSKSANPEAWSRTLFNNGCDIQVAFYLRGIRILTGKNNIDWRFVVQETYPPYALSVVSLAPDALALAHSKVTYARDVWRRCLEKDEWPAYPTRVCWAEAPPWDEARWLERTGIEEAA